MGIFRTHPKTSCALNVVAVMLLGCASSDSDQSIKSKFPVVSKIPRASWSCQGLGSITAEKPGMFASSNFQERAAAKTRNEAAEMGATHFIETSSEFSNYKIDAYKCPSFVGSPANNVKLDSPSNSLLPACLVKRSSEVCIHLAWRIETERPKTVENIRSQIKFLRIACGKGDDTGCFRLELANKDLVYAQKELVRSKKEAAEMALLEKQRMSCEVGRKVSNCLELYGKYKQAGDLTSAASFAEIACTYGSNAGCTLFSTIKSEIVGQQLIENTNRLEDARIAREIAAENQRQKAEADRQFQIQMKKLSHGIAGIESDDNGDPVRNNRRKCTTKRSSYGNKLETVCEDNP